MGEWLTILNHVVIYAPIITLQEIGVLSADYIFTGTDEYVKIIFTGFETDEYKIMFISLGLARTNIWDIRFDFDRPHIYIYSSFRPRHRRISVTWPTYIHQLGTHPHRFNFPSRSSISPPILFANALHSD
jgi:hypothetical protein